MASRNSSNNYYDDDHSASRVEPGISRSSYRGGGRSSGYGDRSVSRSSRRYDERDYDRRPQPPRRSPSSGGQRPSQSRRSPNSGRRRQKRRGSNVGAYAAIAVIAVVLVAAVLLIVKPGGGGDKPVQPTGPVVTVTLPPTEDTDVPDAGDAPTETPAQYTAVAQTLSESSQSEGLAADQMVQVDDLSINESLSADWLNVLLLGTDERTLSESARTDAMMICSINRTTGQVKLASIMRDLAVEYKDIGEYNGTYRINAANYFGGPNLAMKTINELFNMNIKNYVMINFFGFGIIAQRLGGVEVDISEAEMNKINEDIVKQYKMAWLAGYTEDAFDPEQTKLDHYGENIHLNGNQTLAYARIRHLDGGDYTRTTRQQTVLKKLLEKTKKLGMLEMVQLGNDMFSMVKTNMELEDIFKIATIVVNNGIPDIDTMRLPAPKTYKEEVRNEEGMLYDCDFATNATMLYDFIYE